MRDITKIELIEGLEDGSFEWPPFEFRDGWIYAREANTNDGRQEVVRAPV